MCAGLWLAVIPFASAWAEEAVPAILVPEHAQPVLSLDQIKPGMKGYGLTIFHGTKIEPFDVTVASVVHDSAPQRGVIWITSDDPRMLKSGGAQGMSGSPIYLWDADEPQAVGKGGRLIGAFAFVYGETVGCLAGIQPIQYMRQVGSRVDQPDEKKQARASDGRRTLQLLTRMQTLADDVGLAPSSRFRLDALQQVVSQCVGAQPAMPTVQKREGGELEPMRVPLSLGSPQVAQALGPLLEPLGFAAVAGLTGANAPPPADVDTQTPLQPGAVLSVPFAFGDLDLAGHGTVTDVLPDGTVLGFGHAMDGIGSTQIPMATGYVHFVVPRLSVSFRQAGTLRVAGSLLQDEQSAVAGNAHSDWATAPLTVRVVHAQQPARTYQYTLVDNPVFTPLAAAICSLQSLTAVQDMPLKSTLRFQSHMTFTGGRTLTVSSVVPGGGAMDLAYGLLPAIATMMNNPFEDLKLESMSVDINVADELEAGAILNAAIDQAIVQPGQTLGVSLEVLRFGQGVQTHRVELPIPVDLPEGDYPLLIADASTYTGQWMATHPHRAIARSIDDLREVTQSLLDIKADAVYVTLMTTNQGIAVGRQELPSLPSSMRAIMAKPTRTDALPYVETIEAVIETQVVTMGAYPFMVQVRHPNSTFNEGSH